MTKRPIAVQLYTADLKEAWDEFIGNCKNSHFFFRRDYMEYHGDRFADFSVVIRDVSEKLIAVMPANKDGEAVYSHQGLTFGGILCGEKMKTELMLDIFEALMRFLKEQKVKSLIYKPLPYVYHSKAAEEDRYALFLSNASLVRREVSSVVHLGRPIRYSKGRKWAVNKAKKASLQVVQSTDFRKFWKVLTEVLLEHHEAEPVHSVQEIERLANLFPQNIKLFCVQKGADIIAGTVIYENEEIAHTQYIASSAIGKDVCALDFLIDYLLKEVYSGMKYFDFGISNEDAGRSLNTGLISQKEGFGAFPIVHDMYELQITS